MTENEVAKHNELSKRGLRITRQQPIPLVHETIRMNVGFRADLIVESLVVVEIKSIEALGPVHKKQLFDLFEISRQASRSVD